MEQTPEEVFKAITNVRGWWLDEIEGSTSRLNDEFKYDIEDDTDKFHFRVVEVIPNKKIVWLVTDYFFDFTEIKNEWKGTKIIFEISQKDSKTQLLFTHMGLTPSLQCHNACSSGWDNYINISLYNLITTGKGRPNAW